MLKRADSKLTETRFKKTVFGLFIVFLALLVFAVFYTDPSAFTKDNTELKIWFFDVGQGESVFIETPKGKQILIDGGPDTAVLRKLGSVMAPWDRTIDAVILSHPHADHVTGLNHVLERYRVESVYESGARTHTSVVERYEQYLDSEKVDHRLVKDGDTITFGGLVIDVVWPRKHYDDFYPKDPNRSSVVLRLDYKDTEVLLTGDAYTQEEERFAAGVGNVDVLKVGHSGSKTSTSNTFLRQIDPEIAVISAGLNNPYGHPHPVILHRLYGNDIDIWRTDRQGDILLTSDGGEPYVRPGLLPF